MDRAMMRAWDRLTERGRDSCSLPSFLRELSVSYDDGIMNSIYLSPKIFASLVALFLLTSLALFTTYQSYVNPGRKIGSNLQKAYEYIRPHGIDSFSTRILSEILSHDSMGTQSNIPHFHHATVGYFFASYYSSTRCNGVKTFVESYSSGVCIRTNLGSMQQYCMFQGDYTSYICGNFYQKFLILKFQIASTLIRFFGLIITQIQHQDMWQWQATTLPIIVLATIALLCTQ